MRCSPMIGEKTGAVPPDSRATPHFSYSISVYFSLTFRQTGLYRQVFTEPGPITYSEQCILSPKKSVAFFLIMSDKKVDSKPCHICSQCKNTDCIFRQAAPDSEKIYTGNRYSYGYQRFFGQQKQPENQQRRTDMRRENRK